MIKTKSPVTKKSEAGMNLISLMVGIALSSITMLTATHMFTSHQVAVNYLDQSVRHNLTILTSIVTLEKEIQSAGFGITGADRQHILIQTNPGDSTTPATVSLSWRFMTDDNDDGIHDIPHCRNLVESGGDLNGTPHRMLNYFKSSSCQIDNPIQNNTWDETIGRLGQWEINDELEAHLSESETLFSFALQQTQCSFPGLNRPQTHLSVSIQAPNSAQLNGHTDIPGISTTVCLTNM